MKVYANPSREEYAQLTIRPQFDQADLASVISNVYEEVVRKGDDALKAYTKKFDHVDVENIKVTESEITEANDLVSQELKDAINTAKRNIEKFHTAQLPKEVSVETMPGILCKQKPVAIQRVGVYIPGGTAPLFSTIMMLVIPAKIAGCQEIALCSPPTTNGKINPVILYAAKLCGVTEIYQVGGSQAIAAMALGTKSIKKVQKIFGPGNQYVTAAKENAMKYNVAIDMPAGPSEVLVFADETSIPSYVASDLLSQAEHGIDSQVVCVCTSAQIAEATQKELDTQIALLPREKIAAAALKNSFFVVEPNITKAFAYINNYAPEHLIIASEKATEYEDMIVNAGSVFLGNNCPESVGDYASGTNHTLPTYGWAASYSGVNVDAYMKKITFQSLTKEGIKNIGDVVIPMAEAELLRAHANAVRLRLGRPLKS